MSFENTSPFRRKSWSDSRLSNASLREPHTVGMSVSSSGGRS